MKEPQPLDFEKPIVELQRRLQEIRDHSDEHALDFDAEVEAMEAKIETTRVDPASYIDRTAARTWLSDHGDKPSLRWFLQKRTDALT